MQLLTPSIEIQHIIGKGILLQRFLEQDVFEFLVQDIDILTQRFLGQGLWDEVSGARFLGQGFLGQGFWYRDGVRAFGLIEFLG